MKIIIILTELKVTMGLRNVILVIIYLFYSNFNSIIHPLPEYNSDTDSAVSNEVTTKLDFNLSVQRKTTENKKPIEKDVQ